MAWLSGWDNRIECIIDNTKVDGALSNFPVLLYISAASGIGAIDISHIFDELASDANRKKIAVTTSDGETECYVEIERWDDANEKAWLWVKVPSVASGETTILYLYYDAGKADNVDYVGDTTDAVAHNVWDSNFKLVMHMAQDPNGDVADAIKDSTSSQNDGTPAGSMTSADLVDGKIGKAINFDGSNDCLIVADNSTIDITGAQTFECLFKVANKPVGVGEGLLSKYQTTAGVNKRSHFLELSTSGFLFGVISDDGTTGAGHYNILSDDVDVCDNVYHNVAQVFVPLTSFTQFLDGEQAAQNTTNIISSIYSSDVDFWIGVCQDLTNNAKYIKGIIGEVRVSSTSRSIAWLKATYYSNWDELITFKKADEDASIFEEINVFSEFDNNWEEINEGINISSEFAVRSPNVWFSESINVNTGFTAVSAEPYGLAEEVSVNTEIEVFSTGDIYEGVSVSSEFAAGSQRDISEEVSVTSEFISEHVGILSEEVSVSSKFSGAKTFTVTINETLTAWETLAWGWNKPIAETLILADIVEKKLGIPVNDWITLVDSQVNNWDGSEAISDSFYAVDLSKVIHAYDDLVEDGMAVEDAVLIALTLLITDILTCVDIAKSSWSGAREVQSAFGLSDITSFKRLISDLVADGMVMSDAVRLALALIVADTLAFADTVFDIGIFQRSIEDGLTIADAVRKFFPKSVSDSFAATDTTLFDFLAFLQIAESISLAETITRGLTVSQTIAEALELADTATLQQFLQELVSDGLHIEVIVEIDGEFWECWCLNTAAFLPSVYSGYDYNSFAEFNNTVYGCKAVGIYELAGDTDDGVAFHSGIVLPETTFGSAHKKRFRKAWFGVSGETLTMKMETESGSRTFSLSDMEMVITRDLKGRKWRIALQDFDSIDQVELIPVVLSRR